MSDPDPNLQATSWREAVTELTHLPQARYTVTLSSGASIVGTLSQSVVGQDFVTVVPPAIGGTQPHS